LAHYLSHLPPDGPVRRQMRREQGIEEWHPTLDQQLLRSIQYQVALGAWLQTDTKKSKPPVPLALPGDTGPKQLVRKGGKKYDEVMKQRMAARAKALERAAAAREDQTP
jgi:hypothetical protein